MKIDPHDQRRLAKRRSLPPAPWEIAEIDVEGDLPAGLPRPDRANAVMIVYRFRGAAIGEEWLAAADLPLDSAALAARAARATGATVARLIAIGDGEEPAWTPAAPARAINASDPLSAQSLTRLGEALAARRAKPVDRTASIVICTKGRPKALAECLQAIAPEIARGREVIVVDNGPDADTEAAARAVAGVRYIVEARPGVNRARNTGLAATSSEIVVYVDDDVVPEPGWIEAMIRRFDADDVAVVCGLVLPHALRTDSQIFFQFTLGFGGMGFAPLRFDGAFLKAWRFAVPVWEIGASANMAVNVAQMKALGWLDERLGPGAAGGCGDDSEFWHRALQRGAVVRYEPLAVVRHQHRADWESLHRQAYGYAMGHVLAQLVQHDKHRDPRCLWEVYWKRPTFYLRRLLRAPDRWLRGKPDRTLWPQIRGYMAALVEIRRVLRLPAVTQKR